MKKSYTYWLVLISLYTQVFGQSAIKHIPIEQGVSHELAAYRKSIIKNIQYTLIFDIPGNKSDPINAREQITLMISNTSQPLQIDCKMDEKNINEILVNNHIIKTQLIKEHLIVDRTYLKKGGNNIQIKFIAGDVSLHRNNDYLYALFVPDRARTVFPCFDQPDLKARFLLTLLVPSDYRVLANGAIKDSIVNGNRITYNFANSDILPTYLFSFTTGKYDFISKHIGNLNAAFLHRETDSNKIRLSIDSIFTDHKNAVTFLEEWTGIRFPFQKMGFVAIPDFQFGGMEHPGEVQYKASSLFLDEGATKDMILSRANLISHETAHMWFGDMVTMAWFDDVWMKEVFANFMADKVSQKVMGTETFNLKFLQDHYPAAYSIDRTQGANPIRQRLSNLQEAGSLYGNIIYHKAPIMMRQLELLIGEENFKKGIREYLNKYAYSNATWNDLISILSNHTKENLSAWNDVWVNQTGRPVFDYNVAYDKNQIKRFTITQHPEFGKNKVWPQSFQISLIYPDQIKNIVINMTGATTNIPQAVGLLKPNYIVFNSDGMGYGLFPIDKLKSYETFQQTNTLIRASAYIAAYENMLSARYFMPKELLSMLMSCLSSEKNEMNLRLITNYINNIYWVFLSPTERKNMYEKLEAVLWSAMESIDFPNNKKILFKTYQDIYQSTFATKRLYDVWKLQAPPKGIRLTEEDYTSLALTIAVKTDTPTTILKEQLARITNEDRRKRLTFLIPALSPIEKERDDFFTSLQKLENRQKEAWVTTALSYLNHPLRQKSSIKYLRSSLNLVIEIQKTGDVFFPQSWLGSIFSNYQSKDAYEIVTKFLQDNPSYPSKLKSKILQATDNLYRAQTIVR